jgi:hypothetical protein
MGGLLLAALLAHTAFDFSMLPGDTPAPGAPGVDSNVRLAQAKPRRKKGKAAPKAEQAAPAADSPAAAPAADSAPVDSKPAAVVALPPAPPPPPAASPAEAQLTAAPPPPPVTTAPEGEFGPVTGTLMTVGVGAGGASNDPLGGYCSTPLCGGVPVTSATSGSGLGVSATIYGRPGRYVAVGGGVAYGRLGTHVTNATSDQGGYYVALSILSAQAFPLGGRYRIDPFARFGVGYGLWTAGFLAASLPLNYRLHGLMFEAAFSAPYRIQPWLSVGPTLRLFFPWWLQHCVTGQDPYPDTCKDIDAALFQSAGVDIKTFTQKLPALWFVGVETTFHL